MSLSSKPENGPSSSKENTASDKNGFSATLAGLLLAISLVGLLDASYLSWVHLSASKSCIAGDGCSAVLSSPYALLLGLPVAALGAGMYLSLAIFCLRLLKSPGRWSSSAAWLFAISLAGGVASIYFTALQAFVIGSWCPFCLLSAGLTVLFFLLCAMGCLKSGALKSLGANPALLMRQGLPAAVVALSLPPLLVLAGEKALEAADRKPGVPEDRVVAVLGDRPVTLSEVDAAIQIEMQQIEMQRYKKRLAYLETRLIEMEARLHGLTPAQLLEQEVSAGIEVGADEIQHFIDANKARLPKMPLPVLRERIEKLLKDRKFADARDDYVVQLKEKHHIRFALPLPPRIAIDANPRGGPEKGPADAPVTIIEFSDFECPFCGKTHRALEELARRHAGDIRLVFRHFPLDMHPMALQIAEFSVCVHQQGKFWPFADRVFAKRRRWSEAELMDVARQAGADGERLLACTQTDTGAETVARDIAEGERWGLHSTPSLFINGRYYAGMPKNLEEIVRNELAAGP